MSNQIKSIFGGRNIKRRTIKNRFKERAFNKFSGIACLSSKTFFLSFLLLTILYGQSAAQYSNGGTMSSSFIASGTEITKVQIAVKREKADQKGVFDTLQVTEVPLLEENDILSVKFCEDCQGSRRFADLGYRRLIVFFVNPASIASDLKKDYDESGKSAIAEIKFDDSKSKNNLSKIYGEHEFKVPYKSIPLIFLVSGGRDYKDELRDLVLAKQADVLKLSEQATLIGKFPEAINFLMEAKSVLQTPAANDPAVINYLTQRAGTYRFNQTGCFQQNFLTSNKERLSCLVNNLNEDELANDIQNFSLARLGKIGAGETVAQLKSNYESLNVFFNAAAVVIDLVGKIFKKNPLNVQIAGLQSLPPEINKNETANRKDFGYQSLKQMPINVPPNTEKAVLIAPIEWKEDEQILTRAEMEKTEAFPLKGCLHQGANVFYLDANSSDQSAIQKIKTVSVTLVKEDDKVNLSSTPSNKTKTTQPSEKQIFKSLPVNSTDGAVILNINDDVWNEIKLWGKTHARIILTSGFVKVEKEFDWNVLPAARWQLLRNPEQIVIRKGADSILRIAPNTAPRNCIDRVTVSDERNQLIEFQSSQIEFEKSGIFKLKLNAAQKERLQTGRLKISVYESGIKEPLGSVINTALFDAAPKIELTIYQGDQIGTIKSDRLSEIREIEIEGRKAEFETDAGEVSGNANASGNAAAANPRNSLSINSGFQIPVSGSRAFRFAAPAVSKQQEKINVTVRLTAGDAVTQVIKLLPPRPQIRGELTTADSCRQNSAAKLTTILNSPDDQNQQTSKIHNNQSMPSSSSSSSNSSSGSRVMVAVKNTYQPYELSPCVFPTDTDELKLVLIAAGEADEKNSVDEHDYSFSQVNKPSLVIGFASRGAEEDINGGGGSGRKDKPILPLAGSSAVVVSTLQIVSRQRMDAVIRFDQQIKNQLEDGGQMFIKIIDPVRGESDWYPINISFVKLPVKLDLKCRSGERAGCELSGDLAVIESVAVSADSAGKEIWHQVDAGSNAVSLPALTFENFFYIKLRDGGSRDNGNSNVSSSETGKSETRAAHNNDRKIKIKLDNLQGTGITYTRSVN